MSGLDIAVIVVLVLSISWGAWRGMVHEVFSLAGWILAFVAAYLFTAPLAETLPSAMRQELRVVLAFLLVFVGTLVVATLAATLLTRFVKGVGLLHLDRSLGALFGLVRGLLLLVAFAIFAGLTPMPQKAFWTGSVMGRPLAETAIQLKPWLPPAFAKRLRYH